MPIKLTWKSVIAVCALALSLISAALSSHLFPVSVSTALAPASVILLAFERYAEAIDNKTAVNAPTPVTPVPSALTVTYQQVASPSLP